MSGLLDPAFNISFVVAVPVSFVFDLNDLQRSGAILIS